MSRLSMRCLAAFAHDCGHDELDPAELSLGAIVDDLAAARGAQAITTAPSIYERRRRKDRARRSLAPNAQRFATSGPVPAGQQHLP